MNKYAEYYSEYGLQVMISDNKKFIQNSEKEYQEVCDGKRYNPLCANWWKEKIKEDIKQYKKDIIELEEALMIRREFTV